MFNLLIPYVLHIASIDKNADHNFSVAQKKVHFFYRTENIVGKGQNAGYQHSFNFPEMFSKAFFSRVV